jgi:hypothetical protein
MHPRAEERHAAAVRGDDVDKPRNLATSVMVERRRPE